MSYRFFSLVLWIVLTLNLQSCTPERPPAALQQDRFVKKQMDGKAIALLEGPWACVEDTQTGLHWEIKSPNENPQYAYSTYSWKTSQHGTDNGGSCGLDQAGMPWVEYQKCDTQDLIDHLNQTRLCGLSDWRLPTAIELHSIMFKNPYPGERMVPATLFPRILSRPYWTADYKEQNGQFLAQTIHLERATEFWTTTANVAGAIAVSGAVK